jgi:hypothetical protein
MSSTTPTGYCEHCKQNVLLVRRDIDICLAIILLLFTAGIGLIIYLIIYYSSPKDRCIHCGMIITSQLEQKVQVREQLTYKQQEIQKDNFPVEIVTGDKALFCPLCGEALDDRTLTYCPNCGSKV